MGREALNTAAEIQAIQARRAIRARKDDRIRADRRAAPPDREVARELHDLSPAQFVSLRHRLEEQLGAVGSVTGRQLERLQGGLTGPPHDGAMNDGQARLRIAYQDALILLHAAGLSQAQEGALRLRYGTSAGVVLRERFVRPGGADPSESDAGPGPDGTQKVRGLVARMPSYQEIGDHLGVTSRQAQRLIDSALQQVRAAQAERAHRRSLEG